MTYVLYADVMLVWSSIINMVVLILAAMLMGVRIKITKITVWAVLTGAVTTAEYILMLGFGKVIHYILYAAIYIIMTTSFFTFRSFSGSVRLLLSILIAMMATYGVVGLAIDARGNYISYIVLLVYLFFMLLICKSVKGFREYEKNIYEVSLMVRSRCIKCKAYMDSGNMLTDYATGNPVVIISYKLATKIAGNHLKAYLEDYHKTGVFDYEGARGEGYPVFYPVLYSTVSERAAVMPAFKLEKLCILDTNRIFTNVVAGICRQNFSGSDYHILLHTSMNKIREENSND
ncbi:MAG: sigma-E processing peptidase SpoIIGA [Clostridium sp.]|nr:sigma-E processing peptidase SpoIIGA [Clostridium sp.]MCM1458589.1 sigma-E processing peptidase SpoIIGA [Bacteroides sp.]